MFTPKKKKDSSALPPTSAVQEDQMTQSKAPPPFELTASGEAPAQMVAPPEGEVMSPEVEAVLKDPASPETASPETAEKEAAPEAPVAVVPPAGVFEVTDAKSYLRGGPPDFNKPWPRTKIYQGAKVRVIESMTKGGVQYSKVLEDMGGTIGAPNLWAGRSIRT